MYTSEVTLSNVSEYKYTAALKTKIHFPNMD